MRSFEEIGRFKFGDEANEAYRTYASIWLDFVDDNLSHFTWRGHDTSPIDNIPEENLTDEVVKAAYLDAAADIAKSAMSSGYYPGFSQLYKDYPMLKERSSIIENEFYDDSRTDGRKE